MALEDDEHLDVCQNIEVGLKQQYELHADLTDKLCAFALDAGKTAIKQRSGFAKNEKITSHPLAQGIIAWCVLVGEERIDKIKRSVNRHSTEGPRAYYEFIRNFV